MKYHVVMKPKINELIQEVNHLIASGWKPLGGVSNISDGAWHFFTQAMIWEP
ncbi:DUF1737 domain-containing protein [Luteolibacter pohnpeiensis]|uniref:DUF1737 domain-containing protein n=1 Tax=Luteolibacter pohnpeiensis TaxID=454153 RepID=A0A934VUQ7_9BACT|nr:DUF1737 domain-containing protein [Luteolibacter pohnpeiensis]